MKMLFDLVMLAAAVSLLLATVAKADDDANKWPCPSKCLCVQQNTVPFLTVDCRGRPDIDSVQLTEQLDSLLSSNMTYGRLTSLSIIGTPLTRVPRSVCRLTTLTQLHLDYNQLSRLPYNCLTNLSNLITFTAIGNNITEIHDGLFDGLRRLVTLKLRDNQISSIGLSVFNTSAMLKNLMTVILSRNRLSTLEPWPCVLALNGKPHKSSVQVDLKHNSIGEFTNRMRWRAHCGSQNANLRLMLSHNNIQRMSDLMSGWNVSLLTWFCMTSVRKSCPAYQIDFSDNYLDCSCKDFYIYKLFRPYTHINTLVKTRCRNPDRLYGRTLPSIPLDEFVCELTEHCPPGCRCVHRPANATLHVYCSNTNLTVLPLELPKLPKSYTKYKLDFSNNRLLRRLEHRDYFDKTSVLDVSNCSIETVDNWTVFFRWKTIYTYLHGNSLTTLPRSILTKNISTGYHRLSLYNNPWRCSCDDKWMVKWLNSTSEHLTNPSGITCASPHRLMYRIIPQTAAEEFCMDPVVRAVGISVTSVTGLAVGLASVCVIVYRLRVRLYTRWKFHPFDRDECLGEDMNYDVFLSCSSNDNLPRGNRIREQLEQHGYRVCYPPRDFVAGESIYDNIYNAVVRSKRTVCFVTEQFVQSVYCMQEFDISLHHNTIVKCKKRLIVLMALASPSDLSDLYANDSASLRHHLRQYTYIDYTTGDWFDSLLYALPLHGMDLVDSEDRLSVSDQDVPLLR